MCFCSTAPLRVEWFATVSPIALFPFDRFALFSKPLIPFQQYSQVPRMLLDFLCGVSVGTAVGGWEPTGVRGLEVVGVGFRKGGGGWGLFLLKGRGEIV